MSDDSGVARRHRVFCGEEGRRLLALDLTTNAALKTPVHFAQVRAFPAGTDFPMPQITAGRHF